MTTDLEEPADLIDLVGQQVGTTDWMKVTQEQLNPLADATGHQWIHTDPQRAPTARSRAPSPTATSPRCWPLVISEVLQICAVTSALNDGLNKVRFPSPVPVDAPIRATIAVMSAQKTSSIESVFERTYQIDAEKRPACVASVIVLYP